MVKKSVVVLLVLMVFFCCLFQTQLRSEDNNVQSQKILNQALQHYEDDHLIQALIKFKQAQNLAPNSAMPYVGLGLIYATQNHLDKGIEAMQKALSIQPDLAVAHQELGSLFWRKREFNLAETYYRQAISLNSKMVLAYMGLGLNFVSQRNFTNAMVQFRQAIKVEPTLHAPYHSLGQTYAWMGDLSKAVEMYQTAIQLEPNRIESYYELGVTYMRLKDYPKAITVLEKVVALKPRHKSAHYNLAKAYAKVGRKQLAETETRLFEAWHQVDEKIKPYSRRLQGNPEDLQARYAMVQIYQKHGWLQEAEEQCQLMLSIQSDFIPAYVALVETHISQKRFQNAYFWAKQLTQIRPKLALGYSYLGLTSVELERVDSAIEAYQKAIELELDSPKV
ncbi:TPA: tetratricopeptide repeat protein [Candidatus Poribacteria bacterium]|nr:tetratricopeptide repeat protein [Candidatus Poribacteria bacterium]